MEEPTWIEKHVSDELRMALGDLVLVAADVEGCAYALARIYRVPDPQLTSAKAAIGKLQARAGALGIPPWSDADRSRLLAWCHAARLLLAERDVIIHASLSLAAGTIGGKMQTLRWSLRDDSQIESEAHHVQRLVRLLLKVRRAGIFLEMRLCYPLPDGGHMAPDYVTFGRTVAPPIDVADDWREWARRAAEGI